MGIGADQATGANSGWPFDSAHGRPRRLPPPRNDGVVCVFVIASVTKQSMGALAGIGADQAAGPVLDRRSTSLTAGRVGLWPPRNDGVVCVFVIASVTKQSIGALMGIGADQASGPVLDRRSTPLTTGRVCYRLLAMTGLFVCSSLRV